MLLNGITAVLLSEFSKIVKYLEGKAQECKKPYDVGGKSVSSIIFTLLIRHMYVSETLVFITIWD